MTATRPVRFRYLFRTETKSPGDRQVRQMRSRTFGRTGRSMNEIGFGVCAIGDAWRRVDDAAAIAVVIPSARNPQQARANVAAADLPPLPDEVVDAIARMYAEDIKPYVHQLW